MSKVYDCNKPDEIYQLFEKQRVGKSFERGSTIYGTAHKDSDTDYGFIVDDDAEIIDVPGVFDNVKSDTRIHPVAIPDKNCDIELVRESDFIQMINEQEPFALEPLFLTDEISDYKKYWKLDLWNMRCRFDSISNNSFAKAKKKLTVEKDYDEYCGVKSLFHSIRLLMFCVFFTKGYVTEEEKQEVVNLYNEIMSDWKSGFKWEDFKEKYKPVRNRWHSEVVKVCPRPEEFFKTKKK